MHQGVKCCIEGLALNPYQASMAPTPVDPAAAVKLWLKAADSGQASEHWGRVQRTAWVAACFRSLKAAMIAKVHGFIYSHLCCWTEAARKCLDGKDSDLLAVIQFLFRDFDPSALLRQHACMSSTGYVISWVQACQIPGSQLHQGNLGCLHGI